MTLIASTRSDNYEEILSLAGDIKRFQKTLFRWSKSEFIVTRNQSIWTQSIIASIGRLMSQIVRFRLTEDVVVSYLKRVALELNRVYCRCFQYSEEIAEIAERLYERVVALLPQGEPLQLELFGQGDYSRRILDSPILPVVRDWLSKIGDRVFSAVANQFAKPQIIQLELELETKVV